LQMQTQTHVAVGGRPPFEGCGESFSFILSVSLVCFCVSCLLPRGPVALSFHRVVGGGSVDVWRRSRFGAWGGCPEHALRRPPLHLSYRRGRSANWPIFVFSPRGACPCDSWRCPGRRPCPVSVCARTWIFRLMRRTGISFLGRHFSLRFCVFSCRGRLAMDGGAEMYLLNGLSPSSSVFTLIQPSLGFTLSL
jgi:hypothetical protein